MVPLEAGHRSAGAENGDDLGVHVALGPHDEEGARVDERLEVIEAGVAAVGQQELARKLARGRQKVALGVLVGGQMGVENLILEHAHEGVQLHRGGTDLGEATPEPGVQRVVNSEGAAVLNDDVLEAPKLVRHRSLQDVLGELTKDVDKHLPHETGKLRLRETVVEGLVPRRKPGLGVEGPEDIGDGSDPQRPQRLHPGADEPLVRDVAKPAAVTGLPAATFQVPATEDGAESSGESGKIGSVQWWPPFDRVKFFHIPTERMAGHR